MKARIEKKLSKKISELLPNHYKNSWKDDGLEPSELAYEQGSRVSGIMHVGGGVDYWGEGQDCYTVWENFKSEYCWILNFDKYPRGHDLEYYPNIDGFKPTTVNLFKKIRHEKSRGDNK